MTIFLTDDDTDDCQLFEETLQEIDSGIQLRTAPNGKKALEQLQRTDTAALPNLIFMDVNMPAMNGKECLAALKQDIRLQHIPVIMLSTSSQAKDVEDTMKAGAVCFITKPLRLKILRGILFTIIKSLPFHLHEALAQMSASGENHIVCNAVNKH